MCATTHPHKVLSPPPIAAFLTCAWVCPDARRTGVWVPTSTHRKMDSNRLSGSLPPELGMLTSITKLYVAAVIHDSSTSGSKMWSSLFACRRALTDNRLTGTLPSEWSLMTSLTQLCVNARARTRMLPRCTPLDA